MEGSPNTGGCPEFAAGVRLGLTQLTERIATEAEVFDPSLESIVAAESAISAFEDVPHLRGYALSSLVRQATFPEVAYLLFSEDLPDIERLADFQSILAESTELPQALAELVAALPFNVPPMEVLRTAVSILAHFDPQPDERDRSATTSQGLRLIGRLPLVLGVRRVVSRGRDPLPLDPDAGYIHNVLALLTDGEPSAEAETALEATFIAAAEQGLDASTFAARAAVSTGGDLFAAMTAAMSVWAGPLHGGPRPEVLDWLQRASADNIERYIHREIAQGHTFPGFDQRQSTSGDVRASWLTPHCRQLAIDNGHDELEEAAQIAEQIVGDETGAGPSLDWPMTRLLHYLGIDSELFKPLIAIARVTGWAAHAVEQSERNQLLRPRGRYVGPAARIFVPLEERG